MNLIKGGETLPAVFIGDFTECDVAYRAVLDYEGDDVPVARVTLALQRGFAPPGSTFAYIRCALCGTSDRLPIAPSPYRPDGPAWTLSSTDPVHLDPSVRVTLGNPSDYQCHYFIHAGRFEALADSVVSISR